MVNNILLSLSLILFSPSALVAAAAYTPPPFARLVEFAA